MGRRLGRLVPVRRTTRGDMPNKGSSRCPRYSCGSVLPLDLEEEPVSDERPVLISANGR